MLKIWSQKLGVSSFHFCSVYMYLNFNPVIATKDVSNGEYKARSACRYVQPDLVLHYRQIYQEFRSYKSCSILIYLTILIFKKSPKI